jgi:hypothetical protein
MKGVGEGEAIQRDKMRKAKTKMNKEPVVLNGDRLMDFRQICRAALRPPVIMLGPGYIPNIIMILPKGVSM